MSDVYADVICGGTLGGRLLRKLQLLARHPVTWQHRIWVYFLNGHRFHGRGKDVVPNSSGSAPPSMEGSFLAIESLLSQNTTWNASLGSLNRDMQKGESEDQLLADFADLTVAMST